MPHRMDRPEHRFSPDAELIDLVGQGQDLLAKAADTPQAHAQKTLYKHGGFTTAVFAFQPGGSLPEHRASGTVTIQAVSGQISVKCTSEEWALVPGQVLRLAPGVVHAVTSDETSVMLVHIGLDR